ncbi:MAG: hypothetical protein KBF78_14200 [Fuscovulum sp.]|nr:hypothetical protein [Fuscovulum sp.]
MKARHLRPVTLILAALGLWLLPHPGAAQTPQCGALDQVVETLSQKWQEAPVGRGIVGGELIVMIFADSAGDTWTLVTVNPDGNTCLLAAGTGWETLPRPAAGQEG